MRVSKYLRMCASPSVQSYLIRQKQIKECHRRVWRGELWQVHNREIAPLMVARHFPSMPLVSDATVFTIVRWEQAIGILQNCAVAVVGRLKVRPYQSPVARFANALLKLVKDGYFSIKAAVFLSRNRKKFTLPMSRIRAS